MTIDYNLAEEEENVLNQLTKSSKNLFPNPTELLDFLKTMYHNEAVLKIFIANSKILNKACYIALFDLLERNLTKRAEAEAQQRDRWNKRRARLQNLNPKLDLTFRFEHLTREQLLQSELYQLAKRMLKTRLSGPKLETDSFCDYCAKILDFESTIEADLLSQFSTRVQTFLDSHKTLPEDKKGVIVSKILMVIRRLSEKQLFGADVG